VKKRVVEIAVVIAVLLVSFWGFSLWLEGHDKHVADDATQLYELNSLRKEVADLKDERAKIQQQTKEDVAQEDTARNEATTPEKQVEYVTVRVPGVSLKQDTSDANAPAAISFPAQQLPNLADYVNKSEDAKKELNGCKQEVANLDQQNAKLQQQIDTAKPKKQPFLAKLRNFTMDGALTGAGAIGGGLIAGPKGAGIGATGGYMLSKLIHR
jgi:uncharacterized protein YlxW (UPF0749 family)